MWVSYEVVAVEQVWIEIKLADQLFSAALNTKFNWKPLSSFGDEYPTEQADKEFGLSTVLCAKNS